MKDLQFKNLVIFKINDLKIKYSYKPIDYARGDIIFIKKFQVIIKIDLYYLSLSTLIVQAKFDVCQVERSRDLIILKTIIKLSIIILTM